MKTISFIALNVRSAIPFDQNRSFCFQTIVAFFPKSTILCKQLRPKVQKASLWVHNAQEKCRVEMKFHKTTGFLRVPWSNNLGNHCPKVIPNLDDYGSIVTHSKASRLPNVPSPEADNSNWDVVRSPCDWLPAYRQRCLIHLDEIPYTENVWWPTAVSVDFQATGVLMWFNGLVGKCESKQWSVYPSKLTCTFLL